MMYSKKTILWPVVISIIGHAALISASGMIDLRDNIKVAEIFTVDIGEPREKEAKKEEEKNKKITKPAAKESREIKIPSSEGWREDTIDLNSSDLRYSAYLVKIKKRLLQIWQYPQKAYDQNETGVVSVKISIDADGRLAGANLMSSSGSVNLDEGTIGVVRGAAPYEPLPASYGLSRLHVIASFDYALVGNN